MTPSQLSNGPVAGDSNLLAALLESVDVAVVACDMEGNPTHLNMRALEVMRMNGSGDPDPSTWVAQVTPRTAAGRPLTLEELPLIRALQGEVVTDVDLLIQTPEGDVLVNTTARPILGPDGTQLGAVAVFGDVTARRAHEASVRKQLRSTRLAAKLHEARNEGRLLVHAQPVIDLSTGETIMQELLLRIRSRGGRLMAPGPMLTAAERQGSVGVVDEWVLERALGLAAAGDAVGVNLSADSLGRPSFLELAEARIGRSGVDPSLITLEITETAVLADVRAAATFADRMRALGCSFALDDFGTGYGTLTYLKEISFDYIKIDIEFVCDVMSNTRSRRLVEGVVAIARCVGQQTIAEGVEDAATSALLAHLGVDHAQGFYLGRPAPVFPRR